MGIIGFKKRFRLAAKFNLLAVMPILATSVGICLFVIQLEMTNSFRELVDHGKTIAVTTARNSEFGIYTENQDSLAPILEGLSADSDIAYVSVMNRQRRPLASRTFKGAGEPPEQAVLINNGSTEVLHRDLIDERDNRRYIDILYPVVSAGGDITDVLLKGDETSRKPAVIGYLRLGLTQEGLQKRIHELLVSITLFTSLLVLLGTGLTILLSRRITSPLERLTAATQEISEGKFDSPLEVRTNDEIADLARSFDQMRGHLRSYRAQVEERTAELTATNEQLRREIGARKAAEEQLQYDALHDALTGLPNRALFMDRLMHAMKISKRHKDYLYAVLFLDLDRFKVVNDSLGHIIGDKLLIAFGQRLVSCLRPHDTVARLGGDEFAVLLEDIGGLSNATYIAERIGAEMAAPFTVSGHDAFATASIGIALGAAGYEQPEQILRDADTAMYQAKSRGRAGFIVFEPGMHAYAVERLRLETDLRRAVERDEFTVFYQPIFSLTTNRLTGFEALVRWQHPERGLLNPGDFIKVAEETGIIVAIDRLVLREACRQMQEWLKLSFNKELTFISANLSNKQMAQPDLVDHGSRGIRETELRPGCLKLEITENVIIENPDETVVMLKRLKELGVQLYIDDFGTGYSSLNYLHRLPIDGLKIDRSFIWRMGDHGENQQIVKTIMSLANDMNIDVIAEGVETASQVAQIMLLDCKFGQGYLFSKPVDSAKARVLIENPPAAPGASSEI